MDNENMLQVYTMEFCSVGENMKSRYFQGSDETGTYYIDCCNPGPENKCHMFSFFVGLSSKSLGACM